MMVRLSSFRARLLLVIGVPTGLGCGAATKPPDSTTTQPPGSGSDVRQPKFAEPPDRHAEAHAEPDDEPRDVILESTGPVTITSAPARTTPAPTCSKDEYRELVCGGSTRVCGDTASGLTNATESRLVLTPHGRWSAFSYDEPVTRRYQETGGAPASRSAGSYCCYSSCTRLDVYPALPRLVVPDGFHTKDHCIPAPPNGTKRPASKAPQCPAAIGLAGQKRPFARADDNNCCYAVLAPIPPEPRRYRGRAARVNGEIREPDVSAGDAWIGAIATTTETLDANLRQRLAEAWLREARMEHASIAAFARLGLELIVLGAPPALLLETHHAAADEVSHAQLAFSLASSYAGRALAPAPFSAAVGLTAKGDGMALALETFVDGCIAETVAAHTAQYAADTAIDPVVRATQQRIADDESRHAELAWSILAWCHRRHGAELDAPLRQALERASAPTANDCRACDLTRHGLPCEHEQQRLHLEVIETLVRPVLEALLARN